MPNWNEKNPFHFRLSKFKLEKLQIVIELGWWDTLFEKALSVKVTLFVLVSSALLISFSGYVHTESRQESDRLTVFFANL